MSTVFLKAVNLSIKAGWLILAVILVRFLFGKAPKRIHCILWALVALRLICPFAWESSLSLIPSRETVPGNIEMMENPAIDSGIRLINETVNPVIADRFTPDPLSSANPLQLLLPVLSLLWIAGIAGMLLYALISYIRLKKSVGASIPIAGNVFACDEVPSPFLLGVLHPLIYVPSSLEGEALEYVITHERAHIRRGDHWWKPLGFLLLTVYWFNPLCWVAYILLCRDIEMACDERVIRELDRSGRAAYSQALLDCSLPRRKVAACPLSFGEVGVKERVASVLHYKKPGFWLLIGAAAACAVLAVCFLTDPGSKEPDLSFLNYENACSLAEDMAEVNTIYYPPTGKNENGKIVIGTAKGSELAAYLDTVSWQKWAAPQEGLSSPGSIEFCIRDDYRITVYQKPRWARVSCGDEQRYYKTHGEDYKNAVRLLQSSFLRSESEELSEELPAAEESAVSVSESERSMKYLLTVGADGVRRIELSGLYYSGGCENADGSPYRKGVQLWLEPLDGRKDLRGMTVTALNADGEIIWAASVPDGPENAGFTRLVQDGWELAAEEGGE